MKLFKTLLPITIFIFLYFSIAIGLNDFYAVPILPLLLFSFIISLLTNRAYSFEQKIKAFSNSAGNELIITMLLIFMLAGMFSQLGVETGALKVLTNWVQMIIPDQFFVAGIFLFSCILSITVGTSVGTIVALAPLAGQINYNSEQEAMLLLGAIVGGAMFGDNLSFISDTTVAVTKTHGIAMKEKFKANLILVLPAAIISLLFYILYPIETLPSPITENYTFSWEILISVLPYFLVLTLVFLNLNLLMILSLGIFSFILTDFFIHGASFASLLKTCNQGVLSMTELCLITLFLAGLSGLVQLYGGFDLLLNKIKEKTTNKVKAVLSIAGLSAFVNLLLANNTLSIIIVGPLAKEIAKENDIPMRKSASIVDTMTCCIQGLIPYGAQLLLAVSLSGLTISSFQLIPFIIYPILIGLSTIISVFIPTRKNRV